MSTTTSIYKDHDGTLNYSHGTLISSYDLLEVPLDIYCSVWDALEPGDTLSLSDGDFIVRPDLTLSQSSHYDDQYKAMYLIDNELVDGYQQRYMGLLLT